MTADLPLVSIIVITYNSSKYVLETLESAKAQTYQNIELIISDDGSQDDTVEVCQNWLAENKERFVYSQIITVEKNTGIPANCNRGVKASKGEWIKLIAGDDILLNDGIQLNVNHTQNSDVRILCSKMIVVNQEGILVKQTLNYNKVVRWFCNKTQSKQKKSYLRMPIMLNIPTLFYKKSLVSEINFFDEEIKLLEDQPFLIKVFNKGYRLDFLNAETVQYFKHTESVMQSTNMNFLDSLYLSFKKYIRPALNTSNPKDWFFLQLHLLSFYIRFRQWDFYLLFRLILKVVGRAYKLS